MTNMADINVKNALAMIGRELAEKCPSLSWSPNVAQYRALEKMYELDTVTNAIPSAVVSMANRVGKSTLAVIDMIGWTCGVCYLNENVLPKNAVNYYNSVSELRDKGKLSLRLVCASVDMQDGGSVHQLIKTWFPRARFTLKEQRGCYRAIEVPHPTIEGIVNTINVRTFDQSKEAHAGTFCHRVFINEPPPRELFAENRSRLVSPSGKVQGSFAMFATLFESSAWVLDLVDDPDTNTVNLRGHVYEACKGEEVTDEMALEVKRSIGVTLEKNPSGGYITNGLLSVNSVKENLAVVRVTNPAEYEARKSGAIMTGGGAIYPAFNNYLHVVDHYEINPDWLTIQVVDPHAARPAFSLWAQVTPFNQIYIFREFPSAADGFEPYTKIHSRTLTIMEECKLWAEIEKRFNLKTDVVRLGDPNRFLNPDPYDNRSLQAKYAEFGFKFDIKINDNLQLGHETVNERLYYDEERMKQNPNDVSARPRLFIVRNCGNVITSLKKYAMKKTTDPEAPISEKVSQKYKDPCDCVRYLCMYHDRKTQTKARDNGKSDYEKICAGRIPNAQNTYGNAEFPKNRKWIKVA